MGGARAPAPPRWIKWAGLNALSSATVLIRKMLAYILLGYVSLIFFMIIIIFSMVSIVSVTNGIK